MVRALNICQKRALGFMHSFKHSLIPACLILVWIQNAFKPLLTQRHEGIVSEFIRVEWCKNICNCEGVNARNSDISAFDVILALEPQSPFMQHSVQLGSRQGEPWAKAPSLFYQEKIFWKLPVSVTWITLKLTRNGS